MSEKRYVVVMRHGKAEQSSPTGRDRDRALMPIGIENTMHCAILLGRMVGTNIRLVSSAYVRAAQTVDTVATVWGRPATDIIIDEAFNSDRSLDGMIEACRAYADASTLIVSHLPQVADLVDVITACHGSPLLFKPGAFAVIDLENPSRLRGSVSAFVTPSMVRRALQVP